MANKWGSWGEVNADTVARKMGCTIETYYKRTIKGCYTKEKSPLAKLEPKELLYIQNYIGFHKLYTKNPIY